MRKMFGRIDARISTRIIGIPPKVVTDQVLAAQASFKKVVENQTKLVKKSSKSITLKKHIDGDRSEENKESRTNKTKNPTSSATAKKKHHVDCSEKSDDAPIECSN
jgi:hypothetical protein